MFYVYFSDLPTRGRSILRITSFFQKKKMLENIKILIRFVLIFIEFFFLIKV